jgi:ADP-dependent NAD(P)H-hydrate dehydratase / NAD(P)H-hydrate epimerase
MDYDYWLKQTKNTPLFPELEWSRPENRLHAGKLLIVGGSAHGFAAPAEAYAESLKAGIGTARVVLPQSIQRLVGIIIENADFAPTTPSGSFSHKALAEVLEASAWADGVLCAGDLGRNSETAIMLEKFLQKSPAAVTLTKDAVDYCISSPQSVLQRSQTTLVLSLSQLQRLGVAARVTIPISYTMDLLHLVTWLHDFTKQYAPYIIVMHNQVLIVAVAGRVSTTKLTKEIPIWRLKTATHASVWWLQNPQKPFEALSTSIL